MKLVGIENPSIYDNVREYLLFEYEDEIRIEKTLFKLEVVSLIVNNNIIKDFKSSYIAIVTNQCKNINEQLRLSLIKFIEDECEDIDVKNLKIVQEYKD